MEVPEKLNLELPYDPGFPVLGTYPEETIMGRDTCTPIITVAVYKSQDVEAT